MSDDYDVLIEISAEDIKKAADAREQRDDEIERLRAELAAERERAEAHFLAAQEADDELATVRAERDELRAQLNEVCEVLEPFADWCVACEVYNPKLYDTARVSADITLGDLRRARAVYEKIKGGGGET